MEIIIWSGTKKNGSGTICKSIFGLAQKNLDQQKIFWDLEKDDASVLGVGFHKWLVPKFGLIWGAL